jgi:large subunit ribosomal protein L10
MRVEKTSLAQEYVARLNASPFFIVVDYRGLNVGQFQELRRRLRLAGAEARVVKNTAFRIAAGQAGLADLTGTLVGQLAVVTGQRDVSPAAKVLKTFQSEFEKPKLQFGYLGNQRLEKPDILALADLPPLGTLRSKLLGLLQAPAAQLVRLLNTPASQLARVLQARVEKAA